MDSATSQAYFQVLKLENILQKKKKSDGYFQLQKQGHGTF